VQVGNHLHGEISRGISMVAILSWEASNLPGGVTAISSFRLFLILWVIWRLRKGPLSN